MIRIVDRIDYADATDAPFVPTCLCPFVPSPISMKAAMELIDAERRRLVKHFLPQHENGRLIGAGWSYRTAPGPRSSPPQIWPWHVNAWRPSTRLQNLIKAGAYFLAEAQRLEGEQGDARAILEVRALVFEVAREIQKHRDAAAHYRRHGPLADHGRSPRRGKYGTRRHGDKETRR